MTDQRVWFITGASSGFGRELTKHVITRGWRAAVTARDVATLSDLVGDAEQVLPLALDVSDDDAIASTVAETVARFGRIDVLANVAGYGYMSSVEEGEEQHIRAMFDTNVFGLFSLTRAVLPFMRAQKSGHIINITSVAGFLGMPRSAYYSATKHAIEGFSKALATEVEPLGLKVTCVEPGAFRTDFAGRSIQITPTKIDDYAATVGVAIKTAAEGSGKQSGDPARAAEAMIALSEENNPPHHLVLGKAGFEGVIKFLTTQIDEVRSRQETAVSADFPS